MPSYQMSETFRQTEPNTSISPPSFSAPAGRVNNYSSTHEYAPACSSSSPLTVTTYHSDMNPHTQQRTTMRSHNRSIHSAPAPSFTTEMNPHPMPDSSSNYPPGSSEMQDCRFCSPAAQGVMSVPHRSERRSHAKQSTTSSAPQPSHHAPEGYHSDAPRERSQSHYVPEGYHSDFPHERPLPRRAQTQFYRAEIDSRSQQSSAVFHVGRPGSIVRSEHDINGRSSHQHFCNSTVEAAEPRRMPGNIAFPSSFGQTAPPPRASRSVDTSPEGARTPLSGWRSDAVARIQTTPPTQKGTADSSMPRAPHTRATTHGISARERASTFAPVDLELEGTPRRTEDPNRIVHVNTYATGYREVSPLAGSGGDTLYEFLEARQKQRGTTPISPRPAEVRNQFAEEAFDENYYNGVRTSVASSVAEDGQGAVVPLPEDVPQHFKSWIASGKMMKVAKMHHALWQKLMVVRAWSCFCRGQEEKRLGLYVNRQKIAIKRWMLRKNYRRFARYKHVMQLIQSKYLRTLVRGWCALAERATGGTRYDDNLNNPLSPCNTDRNHARRLHLQSQFRSQLQIQSLAKILQGRLMNSIAFGQRLRWLQLRVFRKMANAATFNRMRGRNRPIEGASQRKVGTATHPPARRVVHKAWRRWRYLHIDAVNAEDYLFHAQRLKLGYIIRGRVMTELAFAFYTYTRMLRVFVPWQFYAKNRIRSRVHSGGPRRPKRPKRPSTSDAGRPDFRTLALRRGLIRWRGLLYFASLREATQREKKKWETRLECQLMCRYLDDLEIEHVVGKPFPLVKTAFPAVDVPKKFDYVHDQHVAFGASLERAKVLDRGEGYKAHCPTLSAENRVVDEYMRFLSRNAQRSAIEAPIALLNDCHNPSAKRIKPLSPRFDDKDSRASDGSKAAFSTDEQLPQRAFASTTTPPPLDSSSVSCLSQRPSRPSASPQRVWDIQELKLSGRAWPTASRISDAPGSNMLRQDSSGFGPSRQDSSSVGQVRHDNGLGPLRQDNSCGQLPQDRSLSLSRRYSGLGPSRQGSGFGLSRNESDLSPLQHERSFGPVRHDGGSSPLRQDSGLGPSRQECGFDPLRQDSGFGPSRPVSYETFSRTGILQSGRSEQLYDQSKTSPRLSHQSAMTVSSELKYSWKRAVERPSHNSLLRRAELEPPRYAPLKPMRPENHQTFTPHVAPEGVPSPPYTAHEDHVPRPVVVSTNITPLWEPLKAENQLLPRVSEFYDETSAPKLSSQTEEAWMSQKKSRTSSCDFSSVPLDRQGPSIQRSTMTSGISAHETVYQGTELQKQYMSPETARSSSCLFNLQPSRGSTAPPSAEPWNQDQSLREQASLGSDPHTGGAESAYNPNDNPRASASHPCDTIRHGVDDITPLSALPRRQGDLSIPSSMAQAKEVAEYHSLPQASRDSRTPIATQKRYGQKNGPRSATYPATPSLIGAQPLVSVQLGVQRVPISRGASPRAPYTASAEKSTSIVQKYSVDALGDSYQKPNSAQDLRKTDLGYPSSEESTRRMHVATAPRSDATRPPSRNSVVPPSSPGLQGKQPHYAYDDEYATLLATPTGGLALHPDDKWSSDGSSGEQPRLESETAPIQKIQSRNLEIKPIMEGGKSILDTDVATALSSSLNVALTKKKTVPEWSSKTWLRNDFDATLNVLPPHMSSFEVALGENDPEPWWLGMEFNEDQAGKRSEYETARRSISRTTPLQG